MSGVFKLNNNTEIPLVGFGTFQITGSDLIKQVLDDALAAGYRLIDTAVVYRNEEHIGQALKLLLPKYNLKREDIYITSKLIPVAGKAEDYIIDTVKQSLKNLQTDYIDCYLIHWPGVNGLNVSHPDNKKYREIAWSAFTKLHKEGLLRSIGVSNYNIRHLTEMLQYDDVIIPAVNQVEWHPHFHIPELYEFCRKYNIFLQAYSSLGTSNYSSLRTDSRIVEISNKLNKAPAQVLLRWALQQNIGIIPKARSKSHIDENFDLNFEIPGEFMDILSNIRVREKYAWDPESVV